MNDHFSRRDFMKSAAAAGVVSALSSGRVYGANERIRLGVIGTANRGGQIIDAALKHDVAEIVAICDVDAAAMDKAKEKIPGNVDLYRDFRELLDRKDIDAVLVATPDHWHALHTILACEAGKDVYIEKPISKTIVEGRKMIEAARRTNRVVQVGLQRRSSELYQALHQYVQEGSAGKVTVARCYRITNMYPDGIGHAPDSEPPEGLDWDLWLGPRPERPFRKTIAPYKFRWWQLYSSQLGNWAVHYFDLIRWILDEQSPASVCAIGGIYAVDDDRTIPDTMEVTYELASGRLVQFSQYEANGHPMFPFGDLELRGTLGTVHSHNNKFQVTPEKGGQFQDPAPRMEPYSHESKQPDPTIAHMGNFFDCIKSRELPNCDIEEGHRSTVFAHVGNISYLTKARLNWDAENERFIDNDDANALLQYEYRPPWTL
ncbi:MAG: Gfo/Idh/MocA family oxidoreductase [Candidatus Hydrogenedentes bacterium]|nr:Gfo/Idh/MocA family oxidoreductase [Candidatus Hydrogenedentota bacterium]